MDYIEWGILCVVISCSAASLLWARLFMSLLFSFFILGFFISFQWTVRCVGTKQFASLQSRTSCFTLAICLYNFTTTLKCCFHHYILFALFKCQNTILPHSWGEHLLLLCVERIQCRSFWQLIGSLCVTVPEQPSYDCDISCLLVHVGHFSSWNKPLTSSQWPDSFREGRFCILSNDCLST